MKEMNDEMVVTITVVAASMGDGSIDYGKSANETSTYTIKDITTRQEVDNLVESIIPVGRIRAP